MNTDDKEALILRFLDWLFNEHQIVMAQQTEAGLVQARDQNRGLYPSRLVSEFLKQEHEKS